MLGRTPDEDMRQALDRECAEAVSALSAKAGETPSTMDMLKTRVVPHTRGKRLLFVSNRADPPLESTLFEELEPSSLEWLEAKTRLVASGAERIKNGSYDIVLCATGFGSHGTEAALRDACRSSETMIVRANKGRLAACLRALDRDLGLGPDAHGATAGADV